MRGTSTKWSWHDSAMKRENHPAFLQPGEGLAKMSAASNKEKELKMAAHKAASALKAHQIANSGKSTKKAKV